MNKETIFAIQMRRDDIERNVNEIRNSDEAVKQCRANIQFLEREILDIQRKAQAEELWLRIDPDNEIRPFVIQTLARCHKRPSMITKRGNARSLQELKRLQVGEMDGYWKSNMDTGVWDITWLQAVILQTCGSLLRNDFTKKSVKTKEDIWKLRWIKEKEAQNG